MGMINIFVQYITAKLSHIVCKNQQKNWTKGLISLTFNHNCNYEIRI